MSTTNSVFYGNNCFGKNNTSIPDYLGDKAMCWISKSWKNKLKQRFQSVKEDKPLHAFYSKKTKQLTYTNYPLLYLQNEYIKLKNVNVQNFIYHIHWRIFRYINLGIGLMMSAYALFMLDAQMGIIASFYLAQTLNPTEIHAQRDGYVTIDTDRQKKDTIDIDFETIT